VKARVKKASAPSPQLELLSRIDVEIRSDPKKTFEGVLTELGAPVVDIMRMLDRHDFADRACRDRWPRPAGMLPIDAGEPRNVMLLLRPTAPVRFSEMLFRAHVGAMLERVPSEPSEAWKPSTWDALGRITGPELLGIFVEVSLRHPLTHHDGRAYEHLFRTTFPKVPFDSGDLPGPGLVKEIEASLAERLEDASPERSRWIAEVRRELRSA